MANTTRSPKALHSSPGGLRCLTLAFLPFALCGLLSGQTILPLSADAATRGAHPNAIQLQSTEWVIPELIIGGEWSAAIRLTNRGSQNIPTTNVYFYDNNGNPLQTTFQTSGGGVVTGTGFSFSLASGSSVEGIFTGSSSAAFGHADIACSSIGCGTHGLYGEVTLRNHSSTRPDFVSVFPLETPVPVQYMLYDGRASGPGYITTTLYLVNENNTASNVEIDVLDSYNTLLRVVNLSFPALSSQILTLHVISQETIGTSGTLIISGTNNSGPAYITATALRIDPSNSFAPVRAWVPGP